MFGLVVVGCFVVCFGLFVLSWLLRLYACLWIGVTVLLVGGWMFSNSVAIVSVIILVFYLFDYGWNCVYSQLFCSTVVWLIGALL